jgi:hypothetical protein
MVDDDVEHNDVSQKELPVQCAHDSEEVNTVDKATDVNGDPSKDSDHTTDAENMIVDEPDCIPDSVEVNTVGEANDVNGHPSQEIAVQIDAENSNVDEPDIIHDSSKTNDANAEQTESMVDDDVGGRDFHCFLCAAASVCKILTFFSGGRDLHCFLCASAFLHNI